MSEVSAQWKLVKLILSIISLFIYSEIGIDKTLSITLPEISTENQAGQWLNYRITSNKVKTNKSIKVLKSERLGRFSPNQTVTNYLYIVNSENASID